MDGDNGLEDDDPVGDPLDCGEAPEKTPLLKILPIYGIDQTKGPINEREALRAYDQEMRHD